jgi:hypothetical protein
MDWTVVILRGLFIGLFVSLVTHCHLMVDVSDDLRTIERVWVEWR